MRETAGSLIESPNLHQRPNRDVECASAPRYSGTRGDQVKVPSRPSPALDPAFWLSWLNSLFSVIGKQLVQPAHFLERKLDADCIL